MRRAIVLALPLLLAAAAPRTIPGPDGGGWDYARVDPETGRLFVARTDSVSVFDLSGRTAPRSIGSIDHGHAALPLPGGREVLVTSGGDDTVRFLDVASGREKARVRVGRDPDAAVVSPSTDRAYVMNAKDGTVSVLDVARRSVIVTVALKPGLEFGAIGRDGTLYVNNEDANEIETVDVRRLKAGSAIAMPGCDGPSGLAYDEIGKRLIAACANGKAAVVDVATRRLVSLLDIGRGPDAVVVDPIRRRAYIPCGEGGELDVVSLPTDAAPAIVDRIPTAPHARTGALDRRDGRIYLPTADLAPPPPGSRRGSPIPGTFRVVVIAPEG